MRTIRRKSGFMAACAGLCALHLHSGIQASTLTFEPGDPNQHFVLDQLSPYQVNPFDEPDDGTDHLVQATGSEWIGLKQGEAASASLFWDGGLDGGQNSLLNLLLPDTFTLNHLMIVGVFGSQTLTLQGLNDGAVLYSQALFVDLVPQQFFAGWTGIDELQIIHGTDFAPDAGYDFAETLRHWAIDDLVYNEATVVPLPAAGLLFLAGGLFLGAMARHQTGQDLACRPVS